MTDLVPSGTSNVPAIPDDSDVPVGLEDFDTSGVSTPILRINGPDATFVDMLTGDEWPEVEVIILGLVAQRVLWPPEMGEEKRPPICRSTDGLCGTPNLVPPTGEGAFPWKAAKLNRKTFVVAVEDPESGEQHEEIIQPVPCKECHLRQWNTHPKGTGAPWCNEQMVFPVLLKREADDGSELWTPSTFTCQRSAIKPARQYTQGYVVKKSPMYKDYTKLTLKALTRGSVHYAVPIFTKLGPTETDMHPTYRSMYLEARTFLQTRGPVNDEDDPAQAPTVPATRGAAAAGAADPYAEPF